MAAFTINVRSNVILVASNFREMGRRHIPRATVVAINRTVQEVKRAEVAEMQRVFDRPTPYALSSLRVKTANLSNLTASVWVNDEPNKGIAPESFLAAEIEGGTRKLKRFERALRAKGFLPDGMVAVPTSATPLDAFGNIPRSMIVQILSALKAFGEQGYFANRTKTSAKRKGSKLSQYFVGRPGGGRLPLGVWMRSQSASGSARIRPILLFVKAPRYKARFKFNDVAERTVADVFPKEMTVAMEQAIAIAR